MTRPPVTETSQGGASPGAGFAGFGNGDDFDGTDDSITIADRRPRSCCSSSQSIMVACQIDTYDATFRRIISHDDGATAGWCVGCETATRGIFAEIRRSTVYIAQTGSGDKPTTPILIHLVDDVSAGRPRAFRRRAPSVTGPLKNGVRGRSAA